MNFDSGVLCYLHRGNPIYSGLYLPLQQILRMQLMYLQIKDPKFWHSCLVCLPCLKILCFSCHKQQVLLHLFSFLLEVGKQLVTNATFSAETTSCSLLNGSLTTMPAGKYCVIRDGAQTLDSSAEESCLFIPYFLEVSIE